MPAPSSRCTSSSPRARSSTRKYPRPVSGCAAEVSQRIAEAVFAALDAGDPRSAVRGAGRHLAAISALGGYDPERKRNYIMYLFTGGGYGGFQGGDGLTNGCSTIGISKMPPVEVLEQFYPDPVRGILAARRLGRRRRVSRRLRHQLRDQAAPRRGARVDGDGSRPHRPAGRAGRRATAASTRCR